MGLHNNKFDQTDKTICSIDTTPKTNMFYVHFEHTQTCSISIIAYTSLDFGHMTRYRVS